MDQNLDQALADLAADIARTDGKSSLYLAVDGVTVAGLAALASANVPVAGLVLAGTSGAATVAAATLGIRAARPNLGGDDAEGWPRWAKAEPEEILADLAEDRRLAKIRKLSQICKRKMRHLQWCADCTLAGLIALALAAVVTIAS
ncbi:Pycsar system effector family protein [Kitasatospora kifunensis]|uniref:Pycsar effector protein domain-containing protein n=2 Tax=Kitasatospora kifunensis TaxID=58351 RepID=A0A7W7QZ29_KITKI|nr:hypothetical protein [Kitasatospora kifunensis]